MSMALMINLPVQEVEHFAEQSESKLKATFEDILNDLLKAIENIQATSYTINSNPTQPPATTYQRTMNLASASKILINSPDSGEWYIDESVASYGPYVIGKVVDQAPIHRGRWKSLEDIKARAEEIAPGIARKRLEQIR